MKGRPLCIGCCGFVLCLFVLLQLLPLPLYDNPSLEGTSLILCGTVSEIHYKNDKTQVYLKALFCPEPDKAALMSDSKGTSPKGCICYLSDAAISFSPGSHIKLCGTFYNTKKVTNPGEFDLARYYQLRGLDFMLTNAVIQNVKAAPQSVTQSLFLLKQQLEHTLDTMYSQQNASILKAMLLGDKDYLSIDTRELFESTGTSHLLVISGTHIGLIGIFIYTLFKKLFGYWPLAAVISISLLLLYSIMTGFGPATLRAFTMYTVSLIGDITGRSNDLITSLCFAALIALLGNPLLIYDSGFLLSHFAVLGIALVYPAYRNFKKYYHIPALADGAALSLSISLFSLPLTLYYFYSYPISSLLLNLIFIPLLAPLLLLALLSLILSALSLSHLLAYGAQYILKIYTGLCTLSLSHRNIFITGRPFLWQIFLYYLLLFSALYLIPRLLKKSHRKKYITQAFMLILSLTIILHRPVKGFHFLMLDVGQGECLVLYDKNNCILIDCGSSDTSSVGKYRLLPALKSLGLSKIDLILLTHTDSDHINGLTEILESYNQNSITIKRLAMSSASLNDKKGRELSLLCQKSNIKISALQKGDTFSIGKFSFSCLAPYKNQPGDANELSLVTLLKYNDFSALLTGDMEGSGESSLIAQPLTPVTLYKCAHHGSRGTNSDKLLSMLSPRITLISCGQNNSYGHPHPETLERLNRINSHIYITSDSGAIDVCITNRKLRLHSFKKL